MKSKKCRTRNVPNPVARANFSTFEGTIKKAVVGYAEQHRSSAPVKRCGIKETNIKRWQDMRSPVLENPQPTPRRSQRNTSHSSPANGLSGTNISSQDDRNKTDNTNDLDSMPLQQRLSQNATTSHTPTETQTLPTSEPVLQSQPISPTKLKVTRQGAKPPVNYPKTATPIPSEKVCIKWDSHHLNMQSAFPNLLLKGQYVDATLVSEGKTLKCHRMILSSCSSYFEEVLHDISPLQHPVLFMKDVPFWILKALCDFMYAGEVHILQDKLEELLTVANALKIKGLTGNKDSKEDASDPAPIEIKQELDLTNSQQVKKDTEKVVKDMERSVKEETRHEIKQDYRVKRKEDRKSKHQSQIVKETLSEEHTPKLVPKVPQKVLQKVVPKVLPKVYNSKSSIKNVSKTTSKNSSRKTEKHKQESTLTKEKEKEKPLKKNEHINDPLDLLEPVYEEIAKEEIPLPVKSTSKINPARLRDNKNVTIRKSVKKVKEETTRKKVKKRRYAEYNEDREESPSPTFQSRKGTRSRPNVKIPKFFHTSYDDSPKESTDATIVRVPHTDQNDPLIGPEMETIKAEPLDVDENTIEVEENIVNFITHDQEMASQEEEIIGSYDSPIVNIQREGKRNTPNIFKKLLVSDPVIMDVHTVTEPEQQDIRLLDVNDGSVEIVDIAKIGSKQDPTEDQIDRTSFDPLGTQQDKTSSIKISNVQSVAENIKGEDFDQRDIIQPVDNFATVITGDSQQDIISQVENELPDCPQLEKAEDSGALADDLNDECNLNLLKSEEQDIVPIPSTELNFKIESVVSQSQEELVKLETTSTTYSSEGLGGLLNQIDSLNFNSPDNRIDIEFEKNLENIEEEQRTNIEKNIDGSTTNLLQCSSDDGKMNIAEIQEEIPSNPESKDFDASQSNLENQSLDQLEIRSTLSISQEITTLDEQNEKAPLLEAIIEPAVHIDEQVTPVDQNNEPNIHVPTNTLIEDAITPACLTINSLVAENEPGKETSKDIGAELEECLASTSDISQVKLIDVDKLKSLDLPFEEDLAPEEFDSFIEESVTANVIEDGNETKISISSISTVSSIINQNNLNSDIDIPLNNEISEDINVNKCPVPIENINMNHVENLAALKEPLLLEANLESKQIKTSEVSSTNDLLDCSSYTATMASNALTNSIFPEHTQPNSTPECTPVNTIETNITHPSILPLEQQLPEEQLLGQSPQPADVALSDHLPTDDRLEESLLELDEDVIMKESSDIQDSDNNPEKTLEMIVNDLNESLGCSEKESY